MTPWVFSKHTVQKVLINVVPESRSHNQLRHRLSSDQHLIWCWGVMSLADSSNQLRRDWTALLELVWQPLCNHFVLLILGLHAFMFDLHQPQVMYCLSELNVVLSFSNSSGNHFVITLYC